MAKQMDGRRLSSSEYHFVGEGAGVPGLPHVITEDEARQLGVLNILMEAIKNGNYRKFPAGGQPAETESES